jgi:hypothetical protein
VGYIYLSAPLMKDIKIQSTSSGGRYGAVERGGINVNLDHVLTEEGAEFYVLLLKQNHDLERREIEGSIFVVKFRHAL